MWSNSSVWERSGLSVGLKHSGAYRQRNMVDNSFTSNNVTTVCMIAEK